MERPLHAAGGLAAGYDTSDGLHTTDVVVATPDGTRLTLPVMWKCEPVVQAVPSVIDFGKIETGSKSRSKRVLIHSTVGERFRILSVESSEAMAVAEARYAEAASAAHELDIMLHVSRDAKPGMATGTIRFRVDSKNQPTAEVLWSARLIRVPDTMSSETDFAPRSQQTRKGS